MPLLVVASFSEFEGGYMDISADAYMNEPVRYPALQVIDLKEEGAKVDDPYRNVVINRVNGSCLRLAVFDGEYLWHYHPKSDELFIVVEGRLAIDLEGGREIRLHPWESVTIPAMTVHRTRAIGRTVNLCFEELSAETIFVDRAEDTGHVSR
jgi:mannose-6-phosphate isomerase-like protein (cupin superfamily)